MGVYVVLKRSLFFPAYACSRDAINVLVLRIDQSQNGLFQLGRMKRPLRCKCFGFLI